MVGVCCSVAGSFVSNRGDERVGVETAEHSDENIEEQHNGPYSIFEARSPIVIGLENDFNPDSEINELTKDHEDGGILDNDVGKYSVVDHNIERFKNATDSVEIEEEENNLESGAEDEPALREHLPVEVADDH